MVTPAGVQMGLTYSDPRIIPLDFQATTTQAETLNRRENEIGKTGAEDDAEVWEKAEKVGDEREGKRSS